ncbi:MAG: hypothetical protein ABSA97_12270 [Verrucomicrobiia bacterium]
MVRDAVNLFDSGRNFGEHHGIVHTVTLIAGDGIGPEIAEAVKRVFAVAAAPPPNSFLKSFTTK